MAADICTEEDISRMVYTFYDRIRSDEILGPVFDRHIDDWDPHLVKMVDFWSSLLRQFVLSWFSESGCVLFFMQKCGLFFE